MTVSGGGGQGGFNLLEWLDEREADGGDGEEEEDD